MKHLFYLTLSFLLLACNNLYAADNNNIFNLYMVNSTTETFIIQSIAVAQGTTLKTDREVWKPGSTIHLIAENMSSNGVVGRITFLDSQSRQTPFRYEVHELRKAGQPQITFSNDYYYSEILEKPVFNTSKKPRELSYLSAKTEWKEFVKIR